MRMATRIIIADDHGIIREGLTALLQRMPQFEVVAVAANGRDAVALARCHAPHVVVLDVSMPDMNGIEATRVLAREMPGVRVLALSMHEDPMYVSHMMEAGARGYLLKECICEEITQAITIIMQGQLYFSAKLTGKVLDALSGQGATSKTNVVLTSRERQTLQLLSEGNSSKVIAVKMGVSEKTVGTYRKNLMDKLGVRSVAELTKIAVRERLTSV